MQMASKNYFVKKKKSSGGASYPYEQMLKKSLFSNFTAKKRSLRRDKSTETPLPPLQFKVTRKLIKNKNNLTGGSTLERSIPEDAPQTTEKTRGIKPNDLSALFSNLV